MAVDDLDVDSHYFLVSLILTVGLQLVGWLMAVILKTEAFYDFFGGINFIAVAIMTLCFQDVYTTRQVVITSMVCFSRAELAGFLAYRVLSREGDARFTEANKSPATMLVFWSLQAVWVFTVVSPVIFINGSAKDPNIGGADIVGFVMVGLGIVFEALADIQKYNFRNDKSNSGKVCNVGLWYVSRHPNYFGEILLWWGVFVVGTPVFVEEAGGWATICSPLITMSLLLFVSGIPLAEGKHLKRFYKTPETAEAFENYFNQTSPLMPWPPSCYKGLPPLVKLVFFFEMPSYRYQLAETPQGELAGASSLEDYGSKENAAANGSGSGCSADHGHPESAVIC